MSLKNYLPELYRHIREMAALLQSEDSAFTTARRVIGTFAAENTISNGSEEAVALWEKFLGVQPPGNLEQRKMSLIAILRGQGPLTEEKIKDIVNAFTGSANSATVDLVDSVLRVRVLPPEWGEIYFFSEIKQALSTRIPAHIGLEVQRFYHTWQDITNDNQDWAAVNSSYSDWENVCLKV